MTQTLTAGEDAPQTELLVRVTSLTTLLAVIPHLLGFMPEASVVVIGTAPPRDRVRVTLRYDLPDPPDAALAAEIASHAAGVIRSQQLTAAMAVGYGPEGLVTPLVGALHDAMDAAGIRLRDFLRVQDGRYWSYHCGDKACCPADGTPFDAEADPVAAAMARAGKKVLAGRSAVAARVAPVGGSAEQSMRRATRRAERHVSQVLGKVRKSSRLGAARHMIACEGLAAVSAMIAAYRSGGAFTSDYQVAWLTVALRDLRVRDDAWARMDPDHREAHQRMWLDVIRRAQPGYVAPPAALLAFVAWQAGDGALANVALDRALSDNPRYSMALLLQQVISVGTSPAMARLPMTPEEVAASYDDADADDDVDVDDETEDDYAACEDGYDDER
jgi:hypothetical protein